MPNIFEDDTDTNNNEVDIYSLLEEEEDDTPTQEIVEDTNNNEVDVFSLMEEAPVQEEAPIPSLEELNQLPSSGYAERLEDGGVVITTEEGEEFIPAGTLTPEDEERISKIESEQREFFVPKEEEVDEFVDINSLLEPEEQVSPEALGLDIVKPSIATQAEIDVGEREVLEEVFTQQLQEQGLEEESEEGIALRKELFPAEFDPTIEKIRRVGQEAGLNIGTSFATLPTDIAALGERGIAEVVGFFGADTAAENLRESADVLDRVSIDIENSIVGTIDPTNRLGARTSGEKNAADFLTLAGGLVTGGVAARKIIATEAPKLLKYSTSVLGMGVGETAVSGGSTQNVPIFTGKDATFKLIAPDVQFSRTVNKRLVPMFEGMGLGGMLDATFQIGKMGFKAFRAKYGSEVTQEVTERVYKDEALSQGATEAQADQIGKQKSQQIENAATKGEDINPTLGRLGKAHNAVFDRLTVFRNIERQKKGVKGNEDALFDLTPDTNGIMHEIQRSQKMAEVILTQGMPIPTTTGGWALKANRKGAVQVVEAIKEAGGNFEDAAKYMQAKRFKSDYINKANAEKELKTIDARIKEATGEVKAALQAEKVSLKAKVIELPIDEKQADAIINEFKDENWVKIAEKEFNSFFAGLREVLQANGNLSKEEVQRLGAAREFYFPAYRDADSPITKVDIHRRGAAAKGVGRVKGGREIPLLPAHESFIIHTQRVANAASKNSVTGRMMKVMNSLNDAEWNKMFDTTKEEFKLQQTGILSDKAKTIVKARNIELENKLGADVLIDGTNVEYVPSSRLLTGLIKGKRFALRVKDESLDQTLKSFEFTEDGAIAKFLTTVKNVQRGAITLSPNFVMRNAIFDSMMTPFTSRTGLLPIIGSAQGGLRIRRNPKLWATYLRESGGGVSIANFGSASSDRAIQAIGRAIKGETDTLSTDMISNMKLGMKQLEKVANTAENLGRFEEYARSIEKGVSQEQAVSRAGELTINFYRRGAATYVNNANKMIPFFNAMLQVAEKTGRIVYKDPKKTFATATGLITIPSLVAYSMNVNHPEYFNIPEHVRRSSMVMFYGAGAEDYVKLPVERTLGSLFHGAVTAGLDDIYQKTGNAQLAQQTAAGLAQILARPQFLPPIAMTAVNVISNEDYRGINIVPRHLQDDAPEEQYNAYTRPTYRLLGNMTGYSPIKMDYVASQFGQDFEDAMMSVLDIASRKALGLSEPIAKDISKAPLIGQFHGKEASFESTNAVYGMARNLEETDIFMNYKNFEDNLESPDPFRRDRALAFKKDNPDLFEFLPQLESALGNMGSFSAEVRRIAVDRKLDSEEKRELIVEAKAKRDKVAQEFIDRILKKDNFRPFYSFKKDGFGRTLGELLLGEPPTDEEK